MIADAPSVHTLYETAVHLGIGIGVVRRLESSALRKLRCNPAIKALFLQSQKEERISPTSEHYVRLHDNMMFDV